MQVTLDNDLRVLNSVICHDGKKGMEWHKHKFGEWQSHAKYAMGKPDPNAKKEDKADKADKDEKKDKTVSRIEKFTKKVKRIGDRISDMKNRKAEEPAPKEDPIASMSDEELERAIKRKKLENEYRNAEAIAAQNRNNKIKAEAEYKALTKKPPTVVQKALKDLTNTVVTNATKAAGDYVNKRLTIAAHDAVRKKFGDKWVEALWPKETEALKKAEKAAAEKRAQETQAKTEKQTEKDAEKQQKKDKKHAAEEAAHKEAAAERQKKEEEAARKEAETQQKRDEDWQRYQEKQRQKAEAKEAKKEARERARDHYMPTLGEDEGPSKPKPKEEDKPKTEDKPKAEDKKETSASRLYDRLRGSSSDDEPKKATSTKHYNPSAEEKRKWPKKPGESELEWYHRIEMYKNRS